MIPKSMPQQVIETLARESGLDPIIEWRNGESALMWCGGRVVGVGVHVLLESVDAYRAHWKSISIDGGRYSLRAGPEEAYRIAGGGRGHWTGSAEGVHCPAADNAR